jgi:hypothetical protein
MGYRLTNADKWTDNWFNGLSPNSKLLFMFLYENCDNSGIYEINKKFMLFLLGFTEEELKGAIHDLKKAYIKSADDSRIWLKNYLKHQKKLPLSNKNNNHRQIIELLKQNVNDPTKYKGVKEIEKLIPTDVVVQIEKPKKERVLRASQKFDKPTVDEILAHMIEKEFTPAQSESSRFWNWFESNGWRVGKNPMKNWKGAVNSWMANWYERNRIEPKKSKLDAIKEAHENLEGMDWNTIYKEDNHEQMSEQ